MAAHLLAVLTMNTQTAQTASSPHGFKAWLLATQSGIGRMSEVLKGFVQPEQHSCAPCCTVLSP